GLRGERWLLSYAVVDRMLAPIWPVAAVKLAENSPGARSIVASFDSRSPVSVPYFLFPIPYSLLLRYAEEFVGLKAETPAGMFEAIAHSGLRVSVAVGAVHGLQEEVAEGKALEVRGVDARLRIDQLNLVSASLAERGAGLG